MGTGVYVKNLDFEGMSHETVKDCFKHCSNIVEVRLRHGKYALIFFSAKANANKALEMNNKVVKGNKITVVMAKRARPTKPVKAAAQPFGLVVFLVLPPRSSWLLISPVVVPLPKCASTGKSTLVSFTSPMRRQPRKPSLWQTHPSRTGRTCPKWSP